MIELNIVAACDLNGSIGKNGSIPWYIPEDFKHFKNLTSKVNHPGKMNAVIMGRKTWESLKRPLEGRFNIVVSTTLTYIPGVHVCKSLEDAVAYVEKYRAILETVFVIGGSNLYKNTMTSPYSNTIYLTIVHERYPNCDAKFPLKFLTDFWEEDVEQYSGVVNSKNEEVPFSFHVYRKRGS